MAIRDEKSGVDSYPYPVKEDQRYINLNPGRFFVNVIIVSNGQQRPWTSLNFAFSRLDAEEGALTPFDRSRHVVDFQLYREFAFMFPEENDISVSTFECLSGFTAMDRNVQEDAFGRRRSAKFKTTHLTHHGLSRLVR